MDLPHVLYVPLALWSAIWSHLPTDLLAQAAPHSGGFPLLGATAWLDGINTNTWASTPPDLWSVLHGWQTHWLQAPEDMSRHLSRTLEGWEDNFGALLAQAGKPQQFNQNILADLSRAWNNFIKSGQAAALGIGLFVGYMFRVFTSSG